MAPWTPTENPQPVAPVVSDNRGSGAPRRWVEEHLREIARYGPAPPNFKVEREKRRISGKKSTAGLKYTDQSVANAKWSWNHPFSPAALAVTPKPNIEAEPEFEKTKWAGYFDPPFVYKAGDWRWKSHDNWIEAVAQALDDAGNRQRGEKITVEQLEKWVKTWFEVKPTEFRDDPSNHWLHNPADRKLHIFENETKCAFALRKLGRSLIIVCPVIMENGLYWERFWDTHNRPPIIARWSTGKQALYQPLVLACLPAVANVSHRNECDRVHWYTLTPDFKIGKNYSLKAWNTPIKIRDIVKNTNFPIERFGTRGEYVFLYALVWLQRMVSLDAVQIPEAQLGCALLQVGNWLAQYWQTKMRETFRYDPSQFSQHKVDIFTFRELTGMVLNGSWCKVEGDTLVRWPTQPAVYAAQFDKAIQAQIDYITECSKGNNKPELWKNFQEEMTKASMPPFS